MAQFDIAAVAAACTLHSSVQQQDTSSIHQPAAVDAAAGIVEDMAMLADTDPDTGVGIAEVVDTVAVDKQSFRQDKPSSAVVAADRVLEVASLTLQQHILVHILVHYKEQTSPRVQHCTLCA